MILTRHGTCGKLKPKQATIGFPGQGKALLSRHTEVHCIEFFPPGPHFC